MNFNSLQFLAFLAAVLLLYWLLPHRARWALLLLASYYFYMSWDPGLVFLILGTTVVTYVSALFIARTENRRLKKLLLALSLIVCLGTLFLFKYLDFLLESIAALLELFSMHPGDIALHLILPVGISFYTFQTLSYVIDVYRGAAPERHFGYYALFVSFFPQLVAGPIERAGDLLPQLKAEHRIDAAEMEEGFRIMLGGFLRKCVIADFCGLFVDRVFGGIAEANGLSVLIGGMLFNLQIYGDFAGYSEIAMGCARMMGVRLSKNFDRPYSSTSISEFFRRWHITLNRWFMDYLYIPLGGNRKGKARKCFNVFVVFVLCGLWHGAGWTYLLWGVYAAVLITLETGLKALRKGKGKDGELARLFRQALVFMLIAFGGLIFRSGSVGELFALCRKLFTAWGGNFIADAFALTGLDAGSLFLLALAAVAMCLFQRLPEGREEGTFAPAAARTAYAQRISMYFFLVASVALFWIALLSLGDSSAFLYFQF